MTDDSQRPSYGPPPGQGPYHGQQPPPPPPQYGPQPGSQPGTQPGQPYWQPPTGQPTHFGPPPPYGQTPYGQPQYGQHGQQAHFPPQVPSKAIKPSLWWLAASWGVFVACLVAGVSLFAGGVADVADVAPTKTFASGESITVPVDPARKPGVYIASDAQVTYDCAISGGPGPAKLARLAATQPLTIGSTTWEQFLVINAPAKGDYQLTCTNQEQAAVRYGVGLDLLSAAGGVLGGLAWLFLVPGAGLLAAIAGTIVVLLRRRSARRRLAVSG